MEKRTLYRPSFTECHLAAIGPPAVMAQEAAAAVFADMAAAMVSGGIEPIGQKVHGPWHERQRVLAARQDALRAAGLDRELPCTFVAGRPDGPQGPVCAQLWGIAAVAAGTSVATLELPAGGRGRLLSAPGLRLLWIGSIDGADERGRVAGPPTPQAERMLANAEAALAAGGFGLPDVVRTWIHLRQILEWYDDFNAVRTAFFGARGITGAPGGHPFPASTAVQGTSGEGACVMDLLAVQASSPDAIGSVPHTCRQPSPFAYGSAFSRASYLDLDGARTVFVSGTASVGPDGRSLHAGDREGQIREALDGICAVLDPLGAGLQDLGPGTLYAADAETLRAYELLAGRGQIPGLPLVPVLADICRPDLRVEIEAVALVPGTGRRT
ncbi:MAG: hypothetical protein HY744_22915 [Deltaproteobacteria bacterium]|nr:hypothetical protein [Deltaproteobacteria bacterium]